MVQLFFDRVENMQLSIRQFNFLGFAMIAAILATGFYLEYFDGLVPCLLCHVQRVCFMGIGLMFLLAATHNPGKRGQRAYQIGMFVFIAFGLMASFRQIWLTMQPPAASTMCLPVGFLLKQGAFVDVAKMLFIGGSECGEVTWSFLSISMPTWSAILFGLFGISTVWAWCRSS